MFSTIACFFLIRSWQFSTLANELIKLIEWLYFKNDCELNIKWNLKKRKSQWINMTRVFTLNYEPRPSQVLRMVILPTTCMTIMHSPKLLSSIQNFKNCLNILNPCHIIPLIIQGHRMPLSRTNIKNLKQFLSLARVKKNEFTSLLLLIYRATPHRFL